MGSRKMDAVVDIDVHGFVMELVGDDDQYVGFIMGTEDDEA